MNSQTVESQNPNRNPSNNNNNTHINCEENHMNSNNHQFNDDVEMKVAYEVNENINLMNENKAMNSDKNDKNNDDHRSTGDETEDDESDEELVTAEEYFSKGKEFFREKNYLIASEYLSIALEFKERELAEQCRESDQVIPSVAMHYELAPYYLWYGDSLLTVEEQKTEIFRAQNIRKNEDNNESKPFKFQQPCSFPPNSDFKSVTHNGSQTTSSKTSVNSSTITSSTTTSSKNSCKINKNIIENIYDESMLENNIQEKIDPNIVENTIKNEIDTNALVNNMDNKTDLNVTENISENKNDEDTVMDEELAYQLLELSRIVYSRMLDEKLGNNVGERECKSKNYELGEKNCIKNINQDEIVKELSFSYTRLGDLQFQNENFEQACTEYFNACELRKAFTPTQHSLILPLLLSCGQATFFAGKKLPALELLTQALDIVKKMLSNEITMSSNMNREQLDIILEDTTLQIEEIQRVINDDKLTGAVSVTTGSQTNVKELVPVTKSNFDEARLKDEENITRVTSISTETSESATQVVTVNNSSCVKKKKITITYNSK